jgi:hypothetical protein
MKGMLAAARRDPAGRVRRVDRRDWDSPAVHMLDEEWAPSDRLAALEHIANRRRYYGLALLGSRPAEKSRMRLANGRRPAPKLCRPPVMTRETAICVECVRTISGRDNSKMRGVVRDGSQSKGGALSRPASHGLQIRPCEIRPAVPPRCEACRAPRPQFHQRRGRT